MYDNSNGRKKPFYRYSVDDVLYGEGRRRVVVNRPFRHIHDNKKKEQMHEEKYTEIERENRILLEKIRKIMKNNKHSYLPNGDSFQNKLDQKDQLKKKPQFVGKNWPGGYLYSSTPAANRKENPEIGVFFNHQSQSLPVDRPRRLSPIVVDIKESVFQGPVTIDGRYFNIDVIRGRDTVWITAKDNKNFITYSLEVGKKQAVEFMGGKENWKVLVQSLNLDGTDLSLVNNYS